MPSHSHPKTVAFFADLDALLADKLHPDYAVAELELRILHNEQCKRSLIRYTRKPRSFSKPPAYSVFDLEDLDHGLRSRLAAAKAAAAVAAQTRRAA